MEGSESEAIFKSLNLNPQLFINETLNTVDDVVDDAFHFFQQQASTLLNTHATDRSEDLTKGIANVRNMVQSVLDKRLAMWEKYCLHHCFAVPQGFSISRTDESSGDGLIRQEALCDPDLDAQLESLRNKLIAVEKESTVLNHELQALERHSASNNRCAGFVNEALQLYEQNSVHDFFQEMVRTGSELRTKMVKLKSRRLVESEHTKTERIYNPNRDLSKIDSKGFSNAKLEELEEFLAETKNI
ncbi:protein MIS12 homolog isoform X1 [Alnus glutinosa]|uniref:protein MIS12 homolog isoform X1 n=1 Tax=Alnus glutinosa TaxID=3517 RepID=UPI002D79ACED|nr:protein MIS12 homolog isoform X1 [Alnus glutinosa]